MRAIHRVVLLVMFAAYATTLAACADFDLDKLDVFGLNEKKKLPGERRELFPGGVPGVSQGIPPEYMKGNQPPPDAAQVPATGPGSQAASGEPDKKTATAAVEPEPQPKPKPKRKPKPAVSQAPAQTAPQGAGQQQAAPWPQQSQQQPPQQAQAPWPAQGQTNTADPWPSSPPPGTVAR